MGKKIEKKAWPAYFQKIVDGDKTFELRIADFDCSEGDILVLREWNPTTKSYTGRHIEKTVGYVGKIKNMENMYIREDIEKYGFQIISLK